MSSPHMQERLQKNVPQELSENIESLLGVKTTKDLQDQEVIPTKLRN